MNVYNIYEALMSEWIIEPSFFQKMLPALIAFTKGFQIDNNLISDIVFSDKAKIDEFKSLTSCLDNSINIVPEWDLTNENIPDNSVAMLFLIGPVMGGTISTLINNYKKILSNDKIISTVLVVNTPGGVVAQNDIINQLFTTSPKPIFTYVKNMAASAGMWTISGTNRIILSSKFTQVGSIGVYNSFNDFTRFMRDKLGIDVYEFYATKSTGKNQPYRGILDSNLSDEERKQYALLLTQRIDWINDQFHADIIKNLGISNDSEVLTGAIYFAEKAIELGIAHEINDLSYTIQLAHQEGAKAALQTKFKF